MENNKPQTEIVEFEGRGREFDVFSRDYWAKGGIDAPRYWIMYDAPNSRVAISNEVKQDYRQHMVFHELYEFEHNPDGPIKCLDALKTELTRLSKGELPHYVLFRTEVFKELVSYWERQTEGEPRETILEGAKKSLKYLEELGGKK